MKIIDEIFDDISFKIGPEKILEKSIYIVLLKDFIN